MLKFSVVTTKKFLKIFIILAAIVGLSAMIIPATKEIGVFFALKKVEKKIGANQEWAKMYTHAKEGDKLLLDAKDDEPYISAAFRWKSLADAMGEKIFYQKALNIYERAISRDDIGLSYLSYLNAGNICRVLGDFKKADQYYLKAIEANPGEAGIYMTRAEFMRYDLKAPAKDIVDFYVKSLGRLIGQEYLHLTLDYAAYLKDTGNLEEALKQYKLLTTIMPTYEPFRQSIMELEEKLQNSSLNQ